MVDNIDTTMALAAKHLVHALPSTLIILHPVTCDPPIYQECLVSFAAGGDTIICSLSWLLWVVGLHLRDYYIVINPL